MASAIAWGGISFVHWVQRRLLIKVIKLNKAIKQIICNQHTDSFKDEGLYLPAFTRSVIERRVKIDSRKIDGFYFYLFYLFYFLLVLFLLVLLGRKYL